MKPEKIKYILMAADMQRAVAFYTSVFSFEPHMVTEWWSELTQGDVIIALHGGHDRSRHSTGLSLQFESVLAAAKRIEKAGGRITTFPAQREGEPILLGQFIDPEGNEVFITEFVGPQ